MKSPHPKPIKHAKPASPPVSKRGSGIRHNRSPKREAAKTEETPTETEEVGWSKSFGECCRTIELAVRRSSPAEAHAALDRFLASISVREAITLDSPVSLLQYVGDRSLDVREINMLERNRVVTVRAFLGMGDQDFLMMRDCSEVRLVKFQKLREQLTYELVRSKPLSAIERILRG